MVLECFGDPSMTIMASKVSIRISLRDIVVISATKALSNELFLEQKLSFAHSTIMHGVMPI